MFFLDAEKIELVSFFLPPFGCSLSHIMMDPRSPCSLCCTHNHATRRNRNRCAMSIFATGWVKRCPVCIYHESLLGAVLLDGAACRSSPCIDTVYTPYITNLLSFFDVFFFYVFYVFILGRCRVRVVSVSFFACVAVDVARGRGNPEPVRERRVVPVLLQGAPQQTHVRNHERENECC